MERDWRNIHPEQSQVLHNQGIRTYGIEPRNESLHIPDLVGIDEGVERHIDAGAESVGIVRDSGYVLHCVGGGFTCAMRRRAYIDGVSAVADRLERCLGIFRRSEKFDFPGLFHIVCKDN